MRGVSGVPEYFLINHQLAWAPNSQKLSKFCKTLGMTYVGLGEMFEGDSADMCTGFFLLMSMGGRATPSSVRRQGA